MVAAESGLLPTHGESPFRVDSGWSGQAAQTTSISLYQTLVNVFFRLTPASQVLQSDDSRGRNLTFVILQGERPRHLQQRPFNGDGPLTVQS